MATDQAATGLDQQLEDYERKPVPENVRRNWLDQTLVWMGITYCLAAFFVGGSLTASFSFVDVVLVLIAGGAILGLMGSLTGWIGATTRLPLAMTSRFAFGEGGSKIIGSILAISLWGWYAFQAGLFGLSFQIGLKQAANIDVPVEALIAFGGLAMMTTAIVGYRAVSWLSKWAVPLMVVLSIWALWGTLSAHPLSEIAAKMPTGTSMPLTAGIAALVGSYTAGAVIAPDISRYSRKRSDAVWAGILGFWITFVPIVLMGAVFSFAWGNPNVVEVMLLSLNLGVFAYITLFLAQWTTNQSNIYSSALGLSNVIPWPKWRLTLIVGLISTAVAMFQIYNHFLTFLTLLGALLPPIAGTLIADYFLLNGRHYKWENISRLKQFNWVSIASWLIGSAVAICMTAPPAGLGILPGADVIPVPIAGIVVAVVVHYVLGVALKGQRADYPSALETT